MCLNGVGYGRKIESGPMRLDLHLLESLGREPEAQPVGSAHHPHGAARLGKQRYAMAWNHLPGVRADANKDKVVSPGFGTSVGIMAVVEKYQDGLILGD